MLLARKPGSAHSARRAIDEQLCEGTWIFMSNHAGYRPADRRMLRRKRVTAFKKASPAIAHPRTISSCCVFQDFGIDPCIDGGFSSKQSRFALILVLGDVSPQKQPGPSANKECETSIRGCRRT